MINPMKWIIGSKNQREIKRMQPIVEKINSLEPDFQKLTDEQLKQKTVEFKQRLTDGCTLASLVPEAFATVREASVRVLKMRPFDVQLLGGLTLFDGKIAEMKTGEGKTLCATLPMYLHGLTGKGAHLVTVNDYLAERDANEMGELYKWLGLTYGCILTDMDDEERKVAYQADITYGTNNEFAFDYLRDNMKFDLEDYVQKPHNYCIVDEVDSILIDEARTPLLISGPSEGDTDIYKTSNAVIPKLQKEKHFTIDEKAMNTVFTEEGIIEVQKILKIDNLFKLEHSELLHTLNQSLRAHYLFIKDVNYVVKESKVIIVDEFTGRLKEGSRWSDGLHQAVEAKENVVVKSENQTLASITFQNYFKLYSTLAGMTGTAATEAEEFRQIYKLDVNVIPTNLPLIRKDEPDAIYKTKASKINAAIELIKKLHKEGRPVLVGTNSIDSSEIFSAAMKKSGIHHEVLNAKNHGREAEIITNAGQKGSVTIATNMAGRGTDIKLSEETKKLGGLAIVGTDRNEARRIDNQLRGRSGRQGDPGFSKFFLSLEDDLLRIFGSDRIRKIMETLKMDEDEAIEHNMISKSIEKAQKKVEGHNFEIRKHLLEYDNVMNDQRKVIYRIRKDILSDEGNIGLINEMIEDVSEDLVDQHRPDKKIPIENWAWPDMTKGFNETFNTTNIFTVDVCQQKFDGSIEDYFSETAKESLKEKLSEYESEMVTLATREILLSTFDQHWKEHLLSMDHLKEGVNLQAYAQKDPLTEYKRQGYALFEDVRVIIKKAVVNNIFRVQLYSQEEIEELQKKQKLELERQFEANKRAVEEAERSDHQAHEPVTRSTNKVGRNDVCPCGSGKKFKHCHGA